MQFRQITDAWQMWEKDEDIDWLCRFDFIANEMHSMQKDIFPNDAVI